MTISYIIYFIVGCNIVGERTVLANRTYDIAYDVEYDIVGQTYDVVYHMIKAFEIVGERTVVTNSILRHRMRHRFSHDVLYDTLEQCWYYYTISYVKQVVENWK